MLAIQRNDLKLLQLLIRFKADVNKTMVGILYCDYKLHVHTVCIANKTSNREVHHFLTIQVTISGKPPTKYEMTPLTTASTMGELSLVQTLVENKANVNYASEVMCLLPPLYHI